GFRFEEVAFALGAEWSHCDRCTCDKAGQNGAQNSRRSVHHRDLGYAYKTGSISVTSWFALWRRGGSAAIS
ncbi:hypothetical protein, partial [Bradyrhizobium sp.]|uniref:hypothetical protein n=1 Tax=Bradyrhizobium sp. TaxID=376 RepID=UPI003C4A6B94